MSQTHVTPCKCPSHKKESVLTFDGGGIRGLVSLLILQELLIRIRDVELVHDYGGIPRDQNFSIPLACHYFGFMFGTSTGGIIAIMLGRLRMDIEDCIKVYCDLGSKIFAKKQPFHFLGQNKYDCKKLEEVIKQVAQKYGQDDNEGGPNLMDPNILNKGNGTKEDRMRNRFVPCRVGAFAIQISADDGNDQKIHLFRSYLNPTPPMGGRGLKDLLLNLNNQQDVKIWKVGRATSAAPTYFRPITIEGMKYIDGGLMANNPAKLSWAEVSSMHRYHPSGKCSASNGGIRFLVSMGTGKQADQHIRSGAGPIPKIRSIIKKGIREMTNPEPIHQYLEVATGRADNHPDMYYRFNVETGLENMKLDECKIGNNQNHTFDKIQGAVTRYINTSEVRSQLQSLAKQLVEHRRGRCRPGEQKFRDLCVPGPLRHPFDNRFQDEEILNSPTTATRSRAGSLVWPSHGKAGTATAPAEMSASEPPLPELHDTPQLDQTEFYTPISHRNTD